MSEPDPKRTPRPARKSARKHAGLSAYTFAVGLALRHLDGLLRHNLQPAIVQQLDEPDEEEQGETNDPQVLFHRQGKRMRRGEPIDRLILRTRGSVVGTASLHW